ncbi:MAG: VOC family protein [Alphaproteobacteria bacterium]|jgi:predicted enzyme related to lactoylglutathione lyase|nr:VOC family protein [Candidatus Jidaibacter sp.]
MTTQKNPGIYFEIPVTDMQRAKAFYEAVFEYDFVLENIHGNEMAFLPFKEEATGITGALTKGETYKPSHDGSLIYLSVDDINKIISLTIKHGGKKLFPRTQANEYGFVAEIEDSEGNRIGLSESRK